MDLVSSSEKGELFTDRRGGRATLRWPVRQRILPWKEATSQGIVAEDNLANCYGLVFAWAFGSVLGYVVLVPIMMFAAFPVPWLQDLLLFKVLKPLSSVGILRSLLAADAGVFLAYLEDEVRAANIRRRVAASARALMADSQCNDLVIVTYADGCVVAFDMLTDPRYVDIRQRTRKLLTFGSGLNKAWLVKPNLDRIFGPPVGDILWSDFWASYDPIPTGPLDPSMRRLPNGQKCTKSDVYKPAGEARLQLGGESGPASQQVTNTMNVNSSGVGSRTPGPDPPSTLPGASESVDGVDVVSKEWLAWDRPTSIGPNIEWM